MPHYMRLGELPPKHHIKLARDPAKSFQGEGFAYEHVITTAGFDSAYTSLYHLRPPTRIKEVTALGECSLEKVSKLPLQHHHLRSAKMPRTGDPIRGRVPLLFNEHVTCSRSRPSEKQSELYRNGGADEIIFVFAGKGVVETVLGKLSYCAGDYIVIPSNITYRIVPENVANEDYLVLETPGNVRIPKHYRNPEGQIAMGAPYCERDIHGPSELLTIDRDEPTPVLVKDGARWTRMTLAHHPFDVLGWDGYAYPFTFNAEDFQPLTGTVHLPPPVHQTFECTGFVVCTFAPRYLDHHPQAIKVPYSHSNVDADEVLFYVRGEFGSRKGIEPGSFSWHPRGLPHGPHPGTILKSMSATRTEELAVMFDTEKPLFLTPQALALDDPQYPLSWM